MSAIAGIIRFDGAPVAAGAIEQVTGALATRGPDGSNHWVQGSVALGHCLLRTTPEARNVVQQSLKEVAVARANYDGPLHVAEDLMCIQLD